MLEAGAGFEACLKLDLALGAERSHQVLWQDVAVLVTVFNASHGARELGFGDSSLVLLLLLRSFGRILSLNGGRNGRTSGICRRNRVIWRLERGDILAQLWSFGLCVSHEDTLQYPRRGGCHFGTLTSVWKVLQSKSQVLRSFTFWQASRVQGLP